MYTASMEMRIDMDQVMSELNLGIDEALDTIYDCVYKNTPVRTGYLRSTLGVDTGDDSVYFEADYAPYVEYRTGFFSQSVESAVPLVRKDLHIK